MIGKSSCSSVASSAANRSKHSLTTSVTRASALSTLLTQTIGLRPIFSALPTTNLVCRIGLVDLVDADDRLEADLQRLADHELGLRHRPFGSVDQHDRAVDHREDALDLAAEIGVAGGVDDVDPMILPDHRRRLGENRDAALALQVVGIHHPFGDALVLAKRAGLLQQTVDQRGLAVVDVGDD